MTARRFLPVLALVAVAIGGAAPPGASETPPKHPRLVSHDGARCLACHRRVLAGRNAHPPASLGCPGCHLVANTADETLLTLPDRESALCLACHLEVRGAVDRASLKGKGHTCLTCHDPHASAHERLLVASPGELCARCHEPRLLSRVHGTLQAAAKPCSACHVLHSTVARPSAQELVAAAEPTLLEPVPATRDAAPPLPPPAVQVAPVPPAPTPGPVPTVRPTSAPRPPVEPKPAGKPGWAEARALLRANRLAEAASAFSILVVEDARPFSILLLVACERSTVERAVTSVPLDELFIVPRSFQGRSCFALVWGLYASAEEARAALPGVPPYFRERGATPAVIGRVRTAR